MATNEAEFKSEFRGSLLRHYGNRVHLWSPSDKFRSGIADMCISFEGHFLGAEYKFIKTVPKKMETAVLSHEVSKSQISFLEGLVRTKNHGIVVIGMPDVAVVMAEFKSNYTLAEVKAAPRILKVSGQWDVANFIENCVEGHYAAGQRKILF